MRSQRDLIQRFKEGKTTGQASHMYIEDDILYSYGAHFPMLVRMPHWGENKYLLNADKYSVTTSGHQSRSAHLATVQIPFSALNAALNDWSAFERMGRGSGIRFDLRELILIGKSEQRWDKTGRYVYQYGESETKTKYGWKSSRTLTRVISKADYQSLSTDERRKCYEQTERRPESCVVEYDGKHYLSSMDGRNYFISLLPKHVATVEEAFEILQPAIKGPFERQGEWFFIPVKDVEIPGDQIQKQVYLTSKIESMPKHHRVRDFALVFGHKHPLVRGTVRHDQRDHQMLKLGEIWHYVIESNHLRSWGASGAVD